MNFPLHLAHTASFDPFARLLDEEQKLMPLSLRRQESTCTASAPPLHSQEKEHTNPHGHTPRDELCQPARNNQLRRSENRQSLLLLSSARLSQLENSQQSAQTAPSSHPPGQ